jgi:hypothetical protein
MILARPAALILALLLLCIYCGCGAAQPGKPLGLPASTARLPTSKSSHVVVIVMENREISEVIGNAQAPYINSLANRYALSSDYYAVTHPSLPNYLALTGGSTFGIQSDCSDCSVNATNLVDQLETGAVSWAAYMEGLPRPCDQTATSGGYAKKHDPFLYYHDIADDPARCRRVLPYRRLAGALRSASLPSFVWITPNLCDDGHDCPLALADKYLAGIVPALLRELGPHGVLALTWDEGSSDAGCCAGEAAGGRVATILAGPDVRRAARSSLPRDHYSLLATIEDLFGLKHLRLAGSPATGTLDGLFARMPRLR